MEMELPPPPELDPLEPEMELVPSGYGDEGDARESDEPQVASLLDEASQRLAPKVDDLIEPPFQAMEFLRRKYPNIF
jgi:hypothetical protein